MHQKMTKKRIAIIGAGASGLVATKYAIEYNCQPIAFEKSSTIGGIWRYNSDSNVVTVSKNIKCQQSRELCCFSDFPNSHLFNDKFLHNSQVIKYLEEYAKKFDLYKYIKFNVHVIDVKRNELWPTVPQWIVEYQEKTNGTIQKKTESFDAILVCTGMYCKPYNPPNYRLQNEFQGRVLHSSNYKTPTLYKNKIVVIVGFGNSAITIACDIASVAKKVYISSRHNVWLINKINSKGEAWDIDFNSQFNALCRRFTPKFFQNILWESNAKYYNCLNTKKKENFWSTHLTFMDSLPNYLKCKKIKLMPKLLSFTKNGVEFENKIFVENVDEVIFCTGFTFDFSFIEKGQLISVLYNDFHLYKQIFLPELFPHYNLGIIGHLQPTGSMFPIVEMQSRFFFHVFTKKITLPSIFQMKSELEKKRCYLSLNYRKSLRHTQIEDYVEYMNDLAHKIGCKPIFKQMLFKNSNLAFVLLFGPATAHQYRLQGFNTWSKAEQTILNQFTFNRKTFYSKAFYLFYVIIIIIMLCIVYAWIK